MQQRISTVIFDFGGVLIDWSPRHLYEKIFTTRGEMEWFLKNVCTDHWNAEQDKGRPFAEAIQVLQNQFPQYRNQIAVFYTRWPEMLAGEISESVQILRALQARKYAVYGLTNWSGETFPIAFERFRFLKELDGIVVSGVEKISKPNKEIFKLLLARYSLVPESCVFIDDNALNISAAKGLNFHTIHFSTPAQLIRELKVRGML